jgi:phosphohistidine swiveling domain-containing protein
VIDDREIVDGLVRAYVPAVDHSDTSDVKGVTGNKGKAVGIVRVIIATDDFHKMQQGDVLVTPMTTPDFVILMQKSCAIVTDMGGRLSHAAIVSRELGKPCVIDTKFATQILKDGDLVEVDADNGVVRILKKAMDVADIDWELWIRRQDQPPFFNSLWLAVEGKLMRDLIGGGFTPQMCIRYGDDNLFIRSTSDFVRIREGIQRSRVFLRRRRKFQKLCPVSSGR